MGSNPGCIKENIIKLVAATPVTKQHQGVRTKTTWLRITNGFICPSNVFVFVFSSGSLMGSFVKYEHITWTNEPISDPELKTNTKTLLGQMNPLVILS
jgi:hypothetical protein